MRFEKVEAAEISAQQQWITRDERGYINLARHFGGRTSTSGATVWPEWLEEGSTKIKPISSITEHDLVAEGGKVVCFSGGGYNRVRIYEAESKAVLAELIIWRRWRKLQPTNLHEDETIDQEAPAMRFTKNPRFEDEPRVGSDAAWIARAISYKEVRQIEGSRLTEHEVSRHATSLAMANDEQSGGDRWTAVMNIWPWAATRLDVEGLPGAWFLYQREWGQQTNLDDLDDFEEAEEGDEPMPKPREEVEDI